MSKYPYTRLANAVVKVSPEESESDFRIALESVISGEGRLSDNPVVESDTPGNKFEPGDILFGKLRPYLAKVWVADRPGSFIGDFLRFTPKPGWDSRYLGYILRSPEFIDRASAEAYGSKMPRIEWERLKNYRIPAPPLVEQKRIVDELDRELAEIDEFIADQQRLQDLLQERLVSLTFDLATDASNPDRYGTGHPFWKTLPKGWSLQKLGWHFRIGNGSTPLSTNENYWSNDNTQIPWFNSSTVNQELAIMPARYVTELAVKEYHLPIVPKGSLLMGMIGQGKTRGKVTKTGIDATLSQNIAYLTPMQNSQVKADFAKLALEAAYTEIREINSGNGTTKGSLSCENIQQFKIPIPPRKYQLETIDLRTDIYHKTQFLINELNQSRLLFNSKKFSTINPLLTSNN